MLHLEMDEKRRTEKRKSMCSCGELLSQYTWVFLKIYIVSTYCNIKSCSGISICLISDHFMAC